MKITLRSLRLCGELLLFLVVLVIAPTTRCVGADSQERDNHFLSKDYHALVVGVSEYKIWPRLPYAVEDAREVASFLKRMGFKVTLVTDPTSKELKKALNLFAIETGRESDRALVFYYAGHGETQTLTDGTKIGWIIPRECPLLREDPQGFVNQAVSTKDMETYSLRIRSKHVLMLFDSSFSGAVFALESPVLEVISEKSASPVRQYIIAGKADEPIPDRSMFKLSLLKGLKGEADLIYDGFITGSELGVYLTHRVVRQTGERQHPQYGKSNNAALTHGNFIFQLIETKPGTARLFVETDPKGARVRILNIRPRFCQGIELAPGKYHVEVSSAGYQTKRKWVKLEAGEDKTFKVRLRKLGDVFTNSLGMKFVFIRAGAFLMGSSEDEPGRLYDEKKHRVTIVKGYYQQTTEVTIGQFREFVQTSGHKSEGETTGGCWVSTKGGAWKKKKGSTWSKPGSWETAKVRQTDQHPVTCVSWNDAQTFIRWLSRKEGMTYGLPYEAEWEYAGRAGKNTPFAFGRCLSTDQGNYGGIGPLFAGCRDMYRINRKRPILVASLAPNPWGLFDMHGNVSEWCQDWYGGYPSRPVTDPKGASSGTDRVMRGGHWSAKAHQCRSAARGSFRPDSASDAVGFRLVMRP